MISPGPGLPPDFPLLKGVIKEFGSSIPILGICLGLQAIVDAYGGKLRNLESVRHGKSTLVYPAKQIEIFNGITSPFRAGLYHSWVADEKNFPDELEVICRDEEGLIMGVQHREYPIVGLQFHPESYLTPEGKRILKNWVDLILARKSTA